MGPRVHRSAQIRTPRLASGEAAQAEVQVTPTVSHDVAPAASRLRKQPPEARGSGQATAPPVLRTGLLPSPNQAPSEAAQPEAQAAAAQQDVILAESRLRAQLPGERGSDQATTPPLLQAGLLPTPRQAPSEAAQPHVQGKAAEKKGTTSKRHGAPAVPGLKTMVRVFTYYKIGFSRPRSFQGGLSSKQPNSRTGTATRTQRR